MEHLWKQNLRQIEPYVPGEQSSDPDRIKLNANENPYPPAPGVEAVLRSYDPAALCLYPDANARLLKASIARHYGVAPEQVFVGNGSDDVLALAFQSFFNSDKPIAFPDITYSFYPVWCRLFHIPFVTYPLTADFRIDPADYAAPNGGVVLPNPNAPTSIGEDLHFVQALLEVNRDAVVIIDEAYADFGGVSAVPLLADYPNLLVCGTFSKSRSLAGLRLGFAIGSAELIGVLEAVKNSYNSYTVDNLSLLCGAAAMDDEAYFAKTTAAVITTRERVRRALEQMGFSVLPSRTNFLFATKDGASMWELFLYLKQRHIYIRYFDLPRIDNYVRITIGTDAQMDAFLQGTEAFLRGELKSCADLLVFYRCHSAGGRCVHPAGGVVSLGLYVPVPGGGDGHPADLVFEFAGGVPGDHADPYCGCGTGQ